MVKDALDPKWELEEKYMKETGYPGLEQQEKEHQYFKDMLKELDRDFDEEGAKNELLVISQKLNSGEGE